ncbi:MAG TPA: CDP-diacylglycerol--glycerol-3-phosphate 3-phosphatidyltransferase, partial [Campylobacteraceae bacterium]|nr:CDP-diacylglycerol--glycerol-3-phosphate 3-phosphatidyltransferase [Campylobacteraceae bacterium]
MLNLPNLLALLRIAMAPLMFWLLVDRDSAIFADIHVTWLDYAAALIFVIASVTDFFDGFIARSWNQITKLGGILDPLADKMLMLAGFLGLVYIHRASPWAVCIILTREFLITGLRIQAAAEGRSVSASLAGKAKTVLQMIAIGFLLMNWPYGNELLWAAVALTLYSGA